MPLENPVVSVFDANSTGVPVSIGVPFPKNRLRGKWNLVAIASDGTRLPIGARTLVTWKDGSARWVLCNFIAKVKGLHSIEIATNHEQSPSNPVLLHQAADVVTLDNGLLHVELSETGASPIRKLTALGHDYLIKANAFRLMNDGYDSTRETKRTIRLIEQSSVRMRARIEGAHFDGTGRRRLNYRLDIEVWTGIPTLRLDYHFFNLESGQDTLPIDRLAMEWDFNLGDTINHHFLQQYHTLLYVSREVLNPATVALMVDQTRGAAHVEQESMLLDTEKYNFHVRPPLVDTANWLGMSDGTRSVYVQMQDFCHMRPKRLVSDGPRIALEIWPPFAGRLDLCQGRSRRQVVTLAFGAQPTLPINQIESQLNAPLWEGRANVLPDWLAACEEFEQHRLLRPKSNVRFEKYIRRTVNLEMPASMFDLGDTPDTGYLRNYIPIGNAQRLLPDAPKMSRTFTAGPFSTVVSWDFPNFHEPVWTNNEYDIIHTLSLELMRTGQMDLWPQLRWAVRHNIEVDFIHLSDHHQQHRATPQHSAGHNRSGAILSHFWTQGLLEYYCLTGDEDVREVAIALGEKILENLATPELRAGFWGFTRELGWPCLALEFLADLIGDERFERQLKEIVNYFVSYDRRKFHGALHLSSGDARYSLERQMISGYFAYGCMVEGLYLYALRTDDTKAREWLVNLLHDLRLALDAAHQDGQTLGLAGGQPQGMAFGYELTGDERFLDSAMVNVEEHIDSNGWFNLPHQVKPVAMVYRSMIRFLYHAHATGRLNHFEYQSIKSPQNPLSQKYNE